MNYTRRNFLNVITTATLSAAGFSLLPGTAHDPSQQKFSDEFDVIADESTILFQGDSITDWGRDKENPHPNSGLGHGYVLLTCAYLRNHLANQHIKCYNRGVSGNKVFQLANRWAEDCLQLQPDLLSILIGVNDFWHTLSSGYDGTAETYEQDFRALLEQTKEHLPDVQLVIGEPFAVEEGTSVNEKWFPEFRRYQQAAKEIARDFDAAFIPYQSIFDEASNKSVSPTYWTEDGVHPTMAGAHLMAQAWLETVRRL